jgi:phosphate acyltransferase
MRIVLDAMGSDNCPVPDVAGALLAAEEFGEPIILVGDEARIRQELARQPNQNLKNIEVVHAPDAVLMDDKPGVVGKAKPQSSMHIGMNLVRDGLADAFVTAGNTGAAMAIATLYSLHRIPKVKRPALSAIVRLEGRKVILLDIGANADSKPEWLAQFAIMGKVYAQKALGLENPRVALLSNGEEDTKGSQLYQEASELLHALPLNFTGNIEPKEVLLGGADVVISDGFTGNVFIKTAEASMSLIFNAIRAQVESSWRYKFGALFLRPAFRSIYQNLDPVEIGGAPLLGVNGVVIIGHGRSDPRAIKNAIRQARAAVSGRIIDAIREGIQDSGTEAS